MADRNAFRDGTIHDVVVRPIKIHADHRGWLAELFRGDEVDPQVMPAMAYVSLTEPGVARGPHEHVDQTDYFCFVGPSTFRVYLWDNRTDSPTGGVRQVFEVGATSPAVVIVPPGIVHGYRNIGAEGGLVFNAANRLYAGQGRKEPVDEIRHEDVEGSAFILD